MNRFMQALGRLRPFFVLLSVAALLIASVFVAIYDEGQYKTRATAAANVQARVLAETVTAALVFGDRAALRDYVNALKVSPDLDAVGVFDEQGKLLAGYTRSRLADRLSHTLNATTAPGRIIVTAPVMQDGQRLGTVYLRDRTEPPLRRLSRYVPPALLVLMATLTFAVMTLDARALGRANRDLRTQIAEREKAEAAMRQSQRMEAVGRLTGGIAHDFNNMLAIVLGSLDLLLRRFPDADPNITRFAQNAMEGAKRAAALTQRLLAFSRQQPLAPTSADIVRSVQDLSELIRRTVGEAISVETVTAGGLWRAHIDLPQLETAVLNLAINARDAMPQGGKLTIEAANTYLDQAYATSDEDVSPGQYVMVAVTDTGSGIPPDILPQVFEPFFTTKPQGAGTGLGLSQVHGFIKQSGGHVRIYSEVGVGTTVKLYLPRSAVDDEQSRAGAYRSPARQRRNLTVLVVEDELGVREFTVEALVDLGYDVLSADSASSALELLAAHDEVSILLSDVVMPEMNGRLLAEEALRRRPALQVVFMTGYTRNAIVHNGVLDAGTRLLNKPFTVAQLSAELDAVVEGLG